MRRMHHLPRMLPQIRSFLVVIQEGSLHRAAVRLNISQSALSRQMQTLEHDLGGQLLERSSVGVSPTSGGRALAKQMEPFLSSYDANILAVRRIIRGGAQELRIGYLASAFSEYLESAVTKLRDLHPGIKVKLLDMYPGEQITALRQGQIDLAFTQDLGNTLGKDFHGRKVAVIGSFVCIASEHRLATCDAVKIADLNGEIFVVASDAEVPGIRPWLVKICRACGKFKPNVVEIKGGISDALSAIANDGAVAIVPDFMRHQKRPGTIMIPVSDAEATCDLAVIWQENSMPKPLVDLLDLISLEN